MEKFKTFKELESFAIIAASYGVKRVDFEGRPPMCIWKVDEAHAGPGVQYAVNDGVESVEGGMGRRHDEDWTMVERAVICGVLFVFTSTVGKTTQPTKD